jgi:hypothetical protein
VEFHAQDGDEGAAHSSAAAAKTASHFDARESTQAIEGKLMYRSAIPRKTRRGMRGLRGRGLGRLGSEFPLGIGLASSTYPTAPYSTAADCSIWDFFFNPSAWQACAQAAEVSQINSVPANALAYGYPANDVAVAQAAAASQAAYAASDSSDVASYYQAGTLVTGSSIPTWLWIAGTLAAGLVVIEAVK